MLEFTLEYTHLFGLKIEQDSNFKQKITYEPKSELEYNFKPDDEVE